MKCIVTFFSKCQYLLVISLFCCLNTGKSQISFDFEDTTLLGWIQMRDSAWKSSPDQPLMGSFSLHHVFDNSDAGHDQISFPLKNLDITLDTTVWEWKVRHGYNPSSSNNWAFFITSDKTAGQMYPSGLAKGYAVGVNYSGSDDLIKLWKVTSGSGSPILNTGFNWQHRIETNSSVTFRVIRYPDALWEIFIDTSTAPDDFVLLGSVQDSNFLHAGYFGIYYEYSATQDQKLWIDDVLVDGTFVVDTTFPDIDTCLVVSSHELEVVFSEGIIDSILLDTSRYVLNKGIGNPVFIQKISSSEILLYFAGSFYDEAWHTLSLYGLQDMNGNVSDSLEARFYFYEVKSHWIVINEIMADPDPTVGLPGYEYIELYNKSSLPVTFDGWTTTIGTKTMAMPDITLAPDSYLILTHKDAYKEFKIYGEVAALFTSYYTLTNTGQSIILKDDEYETIDSIVYSIDCYNNEVKAEGGWSLERMDPENLCGGCTNWKTSTDSMGGTPGKKNSVFAYNIDTIAPEIHSIEILSANVLLIGFSENISHGPAVFLDNYLLSFFGHPDSVVVLNDQVQLLFAQSFVSTARYTLYISNISDYCGNTLGLDSISLFYYEAGDNDIVFNEIMSDPEPSVGLPEYEYVELFNRCDHPVTFSDWTFWAGSKATRLPRYTLLPDSFVILCHKDAKEDFLVFGDALGVFSSSTMLTNSGQILLLKNTNDSTLSSVVYSSSWYQDVEKAEGGWALERIDPENVCGTISNWKVSEHLSGGTPGNINSIYKLNKDTVPPAIISLEIITNQLLKIQFDEWSGIQGIQNIDNYFISPNPGIPDSIYFKDNYLYILLSAEIKNGQAYSLIVTNIIDECGNVMTGDTLGFKYQWPELYDILVTEIMADPEPEIQLPDVEYIELYNNTNEAHFLYNCRLTIGSIIKTLPPIWLEPKEYYIICDIKDTLLLNRYGKVLPIKNLPVLPNSGTQITVTNPNGNLIHAVAYSKKWFVTEYKKEGGWSVEMIDSKNPCGTSDNWAECKDPKGGTPGQSNSVKTSNPDIISPLLVRAYMENDSIVVAIFSESLDSISMINPLSYLIDGISPVMVTPVYPSFSLVKLHFNNPFKRGILYTLSVENGICDCVGNTIEDEQEVVFAIPDSTQALDLVINEVLFDPLHDGVDFVEVYHNSDKIIDAYEVRIGKKDIISGELQNMVQLTENSYLLMPGEYYVFTKNIQKVQEQYYTCNPNSFIEVRDIPNYSNTKGEVILMNNQFITIDAFTYNEDMHYPLLSNTEGISLERIHPARATNDITNWHSASETVGFATPGYKNSQYVDDLTSQQKIAIEPEVFSPDNDGYDDVLNITYTLNEEGYTGSIIIYDAVGRQVRFLVNNDLLGTSGSYTWDGIDDEGQKTKFGIYIIYIELVNVNGKIEKIKNPCVVGERFD